MRMQQSVAAPSDPGPFIIMREWQDAPTTYATKSGSWSTSRDKAWKFDTRKQAQFILHGGGGEVVSLASPPPMARTGGPAVSVLPARSGPLSSDERRALTNLEHQVENGLNEARAALLQIRDGQLYREQFGTWEEYMAKRWGFSARHGHRLCDWAEVERNLLTEGKKEANGVEVTNLVTLPARESIARPLARLKPPEQLPAWREAQAAAAPARPMAKHVEAAVEKRLPKPNRAELEEEAPVVYVAMERVREGGDIAEAYSADTLQVGKIREPFNHNLRKWCVVCGCIQPAMPGRGERRQYEAHPLIAPSDYHGPKRDSFGRGYEGMMVQWRRQKYRLGPKTIFRGDARLKGGHLGYERPTKAARSGPKADSASQTWDERPAIGSSLREAMAFLGPVEDGLAKDPSMLSRVHRAFALLRPVLQKYAGMDNMRAERCAAKEGVPIVDAKFHAIDGLVEAKAALAVLQAASPADRVEKEIYHAEKAVDHLECLKTLLSDAVVVLPKGKR